MIKILQKMTVFIIKNSNTCRQSGDQKFLQKIFQENHSFYDDKYKIDAHKAETKSLYKIIKKN